MKLYKKQLRPMVVGPMLQGFGQDYYPLFGAYQWFDEDNVTIKTKQEWENEIKEKDNWNTMKIEVRYVEVQDEPYEIT